MRKTLLVSFAIGIFGALVRVFFPASLIVTVTAGLLPSFATIPMMCLSAPMNSMATNYNDYLYGNKIMGISATTAVRYGIYAFSIYLPLVLLIVMFLLTTRFDLENRYADIMKTVHERKAAKSAE